MYVAPRPRAEDDPLFPLRVGALCAAMFAAIQVLDTQMPALTLALPAAFVLGLRGAFNIGKIIGLGIAAPILTLVLSWIFAVTREIPWLMILTTFVLLLGGIHLARQRGNNLGFIIAIITVLLSVMSLQNRAFLHVIRDELITDSIAAAIIVTLLYLVLPPKTKIIHDDRPQTATQSLFAGSVLRAGVATAYCFWLYLVLPPQDLIIALTALFPLVFPGRSAMINEAKDRLHGTVIGLALVMPALVIFATVPSFAVMAIVVALVGVGFGWGVMHGRMPPMVYQFATTTMLATTVTAMASDIAMQALISRFALTLTGAAGAVLAVMLIEETFPRFFKREPTLEPTPA
ncbi:FUSC family protein [Thalassovita mediterranea]|jgi:hypothetical protein|uniref:Integral membrane bound transporter domain-containing protein n=1 Tax=Thalassovita mediterranea TaxID=340021 RepID=A0A0P1GQE4_9RHOB|nr:FUSC family protein [Thalassovita mediterranea]CUH84895.1 hypothetical protein TM5383_02114 [Thalassovita mediterranea]SIS29097.1 Fusaric acid resistance protein-like [Thalassovita mediterranea]